jgi:hypothetical protein
MYLREQESRQGLSLEISTCGKAVPDFEIDPPGFFLTKA